MMSYYYISTSLGQYNCSVDSLGTQSQPMYGVEIEKQDRLDNSASPNHAYFHMQNDTDGALHIVCHNDLPLSKPMREIEQLLRFEILASLKQLKDVTQLI